MSDMILHVVVGSSGWPAAARRERLACSRDENPRRTREYSVQGPLAPFSVDAPPLTRCTQLRAGHGLHGQGFQVVCAKQGQAGA